MKEFYRIYELARKLILTVRKRQFHNEKRGTREFNTHKRAR